MSVCKVCFVQLEVVIYALSTLQDIAVDRDACIFCKVYQASISGFDRQQSSGWFRFKAGILINSHHCLQNRSQALSGTTFRGAA